MLPSFRWEEISEVLDAAMALPPEERTQYLRSACADEALRQYLSSLVVSPVETSGLLESWSAIAEDATAQASFVKEEFRPGDKIGAYVLTEKLGEGGMGVVFRALRADDHYLKSVAIKLMKTEFSSRVNLMRFRVERQVLASLEHPNIARLLDGGATDKGMPYVVLELVEGQAIDLYCDARKLSILDRVTLFQSVCEAVHFAHQHLVIHRDLKPSNVLVTAQGQVKLLDFGIAKILDAESFPQEVEATLPLVRMLSPEYASPEQVRGEAISTTSDVYSLGVLLYQLLTGHKPYTLTTGSLAELNTLVCETDPLRPSVAVLRETEIKEGGVPRRVTPEQTSCVREGTPERLRRRLEGDLDCIVLKAMRKEPERRYQSVKELADDLQHHILGLPVSARADTLTYRVSRFVRRHTTLVVAAAVVLVTLLAGIAFTLHEAHVALAEKAKAERRFNNVRGLAHSNIFELFDAIEKLPNSEQARHLAVQRALETLDELSHDANGNRELQVELARGYEKIGDIQGAYSGAGIGDTAAALASYQRALAMHPAANSSRDGAADELKRQATLEGKIARSLIIGGRTDEASKAAAEAVRFAEQAVQERPAGTEELSLLAQSHLTLARVFGGSGSSSSTRQIPEAVHHDEQALQVIEQYRQANGSNAAALLGRAKMLLAFHLSKSRRFGEAAQLYNEVLQDAAIRRSMDTGSLVRLYNNRGLNFEKQADHARAAAEYRAALPLTLARAAKTPNDLDAVSDVAIFKAHVAVEEIRLKGRHTTAKVADLDEAIRTVERLYHDDPSQAFYGSLLVIGYAYQGEVASILGNTVSAEQHFQHAVEMAKALAAKDPTEIESQLSIAKLFLAQSRVAAQRMQYAAAQELNHQAATDIERLLQKRPSDAEMLYLAAVVRSTEDKLRGCQDLRPCPKALGMDFPSLIN